LGVVQIKKLNIINQLRNNIAEWYDMALSEDNRIKTPIIREYNYSARHLYPILLTSGLEKKRNEVILNLREKNIYPSVHFIPIHHHTFFKSLIETRKNYPVNLPITEKLFAGEISLPLFPGLQKKQVKYVAEALKDIINKI
jgi:dTDP-4-amino-4,6-dideoxygalactose transaminase